MVKIEKDYLVIAKMFTSGFRDDDDNVPHEIFNYHVNDEGELFIYLPPHGSYPDEYYSHEEKGNKSHTLVKYVLLTSSGSGSRRENKEVLEAEYLIEIDQEVDLFKGVKRLKDTGKCGKDERKKIIEKNEENCKKYTYGGVTVVNLAPYLASEDGTKTNEKCCYLTFKAKKNKIWKLKDTSPNLIVSKKNEDIAEYKPNCLLEIPEIAAHQLKFLEPGEYKELLDKGEWDRVVDVEKEFNKIPSERCDFGLSFLDLIDKRDYELAYSNMLAKYFKSSNLFEKLFDGRKVISINNQKNFNDKIELKDVKKISIERELYAEKNVDTENKYRGFIDLWIETEKYVFIIENKIKSGLNNKKDDNQLDKYRKYALKLIEDKDSSCYKKTIVMFLLQPGNKENKKIVLNEKDSKFVNELYYRDICDILLNPDNKVEDSLDDDLCKHYYDEFVDAIEYQTKDWKEKIDFRLLKAINKHKEKSNKI